MIISASSDTGRVRSDNQDTHCAIDLRPDWPGHILVVADGMGGYEAGGAASGAAVAAFVAHLRRNLAATRDIEAELKAAMEAAHSAVVALAEDVPGGRTGTTLTAALLGDSCLFWAHTGDSRLYVVRGGEAQQITDDHSVVGELVRQGSLSEAEAMTHPQRNLLTHALGTPGSLRVDTGRLTPAAGDVYVLCSDGLTNLVRAEEVAHAVSHGLTDAAERLVALANERGGHDNITVLAVAP